LAVRPIGAQASAGRATLFGAAFGAAGVCAQVGGAISNSTSKIFFIGITHSECVLLDAV
jgi:hypothetical protein